MSDLGTAFSPPPYSAGTLIRQAREAAGLHIGALAVSLKVPVRKIEALESDRLHELPDAVFARALASSICRTLKVDPEPVLAGLPAASPVLLASAESELLASFGSTQGSARGAVMEHLSKPFVLLGGALVVGAMAIWFAPDRTSVEPTVSVPQVLPNAGAVVPAAVKPSVPVEAPAVGATVAGPVSSAIGVQAGNSLLPGATAVAIAPAVDSSQQTGVSLPGFQPAGVTVEPAPSNQPGVVQFSASGTSWIEVTDAKGVVQLRKTLGQGESAQVSGVLPLRVIVGRADVTSVLVRGAPFGLPAVSRDNVARFEVK